MSECEIKVGLNEKNYIFYLYMRDDDFRYVSEKSSMT